MNAITTTSSAEHVAASILRDATDPDRAFELSGEAVEGFGPSADAFNDVLSRALRDSESASEVADAALAAFEAFWKEGYMVGLAVGIRLAGGMR